MTDEYSAQKFGELLESNRGLKDSVERLTIKMESAIIALNRFSDKLESHDEKWEAQKDINNTVVEIDTARRDVSSRVKGAIFITGLGGTGGWLYNLLHKMTGI
jgi:hypothetical protein